MHPKLCAPPRNTPLLYGSVCSGIEAVSLAWQPLGLEAAWFAEIEPFPSAVLAHRYPRVPNLGDMTAIARQVRAGTVPAPDILVGGTPCQSFSVAGSRRGLDDPRGALSLAYVELANAIDQTRQQDSRPAATLVWENVPGVLNDRSNAFGHFLGALAGESRALQPPGENGRTLVVCLDPAAASPGACSTLNISVSPNAASVCFLWQVVEMVSIPPKYFLSAQACSGILVRAARRGKKLPALLDRVLTQQAHAQDLQDSQN